MTDITPVTRIAAELGIRPAQIEATLELHRSGATVPFIARYRKEATSGLDEVQIQAVIDREQEIRELEERRETILKTIAEQGKLTAELERSIRSCQSRTELEDLYLPYRPKRRTRATIAKEKGLEPLADMMWSDRGPTPLYSRGTSRDSLTGSFVDVDKGVASPDEALAGARDICAERFAEDAELRRLARALASSRGKLRSEVTRAMKETKSKFEQYYDHEEPIAKAPSHRVLAIYRGEAEGLLSARFVFPDEDILASLRNRALGTSRPDPSRHPQRIFFADLMLALDDGYKRLLAPSLELELRSDLKDQADRAAIEVFGQNLRNLLLAPPAGNRSVIALDPGLRTGTKLAVLDSTGRVLDTATLYTERGQNERQQAEKALTELVCRHDPQLIAVGNGTGNREAESFVRSVLESAGRQVPVVSVSEQGASVYSASEVAREEFPELDVSLRGAVSIGRRLQDPLGELVKIDPKSIGVGQYQHDVNQVLLKKKLGETVDSCVNLVGVDLNTASAQLLEHVSGIGSVLARRIVTHRNENGAFRSRSDLLEVRGLGPKAYEQCAGFLRIRGGYPLDDSAVHPERYALVERMAKDLGVPVQQLVGNAELASTIPLKSYVSEEVGEPTLRDILSELQKPGRDPRGDFAPPQFREELKDISDLREGMLLEGVVTNVTAFGAFVDVGVHQDGLVHVSQLSKKFVREASEVVKVGDRVQVKVITVDRDRKRIALSMKQV